jgi:twinkle protein
MLPAEYEAGITYADLDIEVCRPNERGDCKTRCPVCIGTHSHHNSGAKDLSLNVEKGEWNCHRCGWHGGLGNEARKRRGDEQMVHRAVITPIRPLRPQIQAYVTPAEIHTPTLKGNGLDEWARDWFEQRAIPVSVVESFGVVSSTRKMKDGSTGQVIEFPYYLKGDLVNVKYRILPKTFRQPGDTVRTLFNLDTCQQFPTAVVVEGELDVLACATAGWANVVSSPDGAPGRIIDPDTGEMKGIADVGNKDMAFREPAAKAMFENAVRIIVATDADAEGKKLGDHLVKLFGATKCWRVDWNDYGAKDANDMLMRHGADALDGALSRAKPVPLPGVRSLSYQRDALHRLYEEGFAPGVTSGWHEFDHFFMPETGKLVVIQGYSSRGKTTWISALLSNLAQHNDWRVALYSPEMGEEGEVLGKFVQIANDAPYLPTAEKRMSLDALDLGVDWVGERFYEIYAEDSDKDGFAALTVPQILTLAEPTVVKHGVKCLVIDPWNECESARPKGMTVEEYISVSLGTIRRWAKRMGVMVIIVQHPRKPDSAKDIDRAPHPLEASGAMHWWNKADVFLSVNRFLSGEDVGITEVEIYKHRKEGITGNLGKARFRFVPATGRFYWDGSDVPAIGSHPWPDLPDELRIVPRPMVAATMFTEDDNF